MNELNRRLNEKTDLFHMTGVFSCSLPTSMHFAIQYNDDFSDFARKCMSCQIFTGMKLHGSSTFSQNLNRKEQVKRDKKFINPFHNGPILLIFKVL
jgi:hypothetical protein